MKVSRFNEGEFWQKKPKFKVGDIVYVVNNENREYLLYIGDDYEISSIETRENSILYKLKGMGDMCFRENRFVTELEYNVMKYNL